AILLRTPKYLCCPQISQNSESHRKASKLMKSKIFQSLKTAAAVSCALLGAALLTACSDGKKVGDVSLGFLTFKNIQIDAFIDPQVPGVTCHAASIESPLTLADPSDSSVSCRQTGEITQAMIDAIDKSKDGEVIFTKSKSIFFKYMKIRRIYDAENQTLLYVSYSTKETSGSFKHSLSTVPLWGTEAYKKPLPPLGDANQQ
ncbi:CreA family protein, partial [Sutterella wadsworthensis]